tara:strand:+ start:512 stop:775 length:264 start_codon:yes stop_codon:yes gene_type:complete
MTPKEKALHLYLIYWDRLYEEQSRVIPTELAEQSKQCALICVDEVLENFDEGFIRFSNNDAIKNKLHITSHYTLGFYKEVKEEINKL